MHPQLVRIMQKHAKAWNELPKEQRLKYIRENDKALLKCTSDIRDLPPKLYGQRD